MLGACGIIEQSEAELICKELEQIYKDIQNQKHYLLTQMRKMYTPL